MVLRLSGGWAGNMWHVCVFGTHMFQDPHVFRGKCEKVKSSLRKDIAIITCTKSVSQVVLIMDHG